MACREALLSWDRDMLRHVRWLDTVAQPCCMLQVESEHNFSFVLEFLATFAHDVPPAMDIKDRLDDICFLI